jgi:hypothetical protein
MDVTKWELCSTQFSALSNAATSSSNMSSKLLAATSNASPSSSQSRSPPLAYSGKSICFGSSSSLLPSSPLSPGMLSSS